jgi:hypothetical protein
VVLALVAAAFLRPGPVQGCLYVGSDEFAKSFERADYIVSATLDKVVRGQIEELTITELLKGRRVSDLLIEFYPPLDCGGDHYATGQEWVLFLAESSKRGGEVEYRISAGSFRIPPVEAEAEDWTRARLAAIRAARDDGSPLVDVRWSVREIPGSAYCVLEKPLHGEEVTGQIEFVAGPNGVRLQVDYRVRDRADANGSPDQELTLDIGGVPHEVAPEGAWAATPGEFVALGGPALYVLDSLALVRGGRVRAHLAGDLETNVGMEGFASALGRFRKCRRLSSRDGGGR